MPPKVLPLEEHEILVKVEAMLQDPSDWKCTYAHRIAEGREITDSPLS